MRAAVRTLLDGLGGIAVLGIDHEIGADLLGQRKFGVIDVDGTDLETHDFGVLNGEVSETAHAGNDDPLACLRLGLLDSLVGRNTGTDDGRGLLGVKACRYVSDVVWIAYEIFGEAAILGVAAELCLGADRLPRRKTMFTVTARRVEPRHADSVALFDNLDARANRGDPTDGLMTR